MHSRRMTLLMRILLGVYVAVMIWLLFIFRRLSLVDYTAPYLPQLSYNLLPFETITYFAQVIRTSPYPERVLSVYANLLGNVVMFIPLGFFLAYFIPACRKAGRCALAALLIMLAVELTQFFTLLGSLDFDDLLLNTVGALLGLALYRLISRIRT